MTLNGKELAEVLSDNDKSEEVCYITLKSDFFM